jgi:hypothetical protein
MTPVVWKPPIFLLPWFIDCLHKIGPCRIDAIRKILALVEWMSIDLIVNHRSIPLCKPTKDGRSPEHGDVIMEIGVQ